MSDINKLAGSKDCDEGENGERGEKGERGRRGPRGHDGCDGHDGHDGATGPTGPAGPVSTGGSTGPTGSAGSTGFTGPTGPASSTSGGGLLKFAGITFSEGPAFLEDFNGGAFVGQNLRPRYPVAIDRNLRNMAANIGEFIVPQGGTITFELLMNNVVVPGFLIVYGSNDTGVKSVAAGPELFLGFPVPDTLDLRVTQNNVGADVPVTATVGVE